MAEFNYQEFVGVAPSAPVSLPADAEIGWGDYLSQKTKEPTSLLLDVRPKEHFEVFHLPDSIGLTTKELKLINSHEGFFEKISERTSSDAAKPTVVYCMCRKGNQSKIAASHLLSLGISNNCFLIPL